MKKRILLMTAILGVSGLFLCIHAYVRRTPLSIDENVMKMIALEGYDKCSMMKFSNKNIRPITMKCSVTSDEINAYIQEELGNNYSKTPILDRNKIEPDDLAVADYIVMDGSVKVGETKDAPIRVGSGHYDVFLEQKILGLNKGKEYVFDWKVPSGHDNAEWAGKNLTIRITVKELYKIEIPSIETYAHQVGDKSVEEYKKRIQQKLLGEKKTVLLSQGIEELLDSLIEASSFHMDEDTVVDHALLYYQNYQHLAEICGENVENYLNLDGESEDIYTKCYRDSERDIQRYFVIGRLAYNSGMRIKDEELKSHCKEKGIRYDTIDEDDKVRVKYAILEKQVLDELEKKIHIETK